MNNICFNERQNIWTTRYDWNPVVSENINGKMYSIGGMDSDETNNQIWVHSTDKYNPTKWYNKQHVFEFEFVVSDPIGVHKIFDNLQIISNNVQPNEMEITVIGDSYEFKRDLIKAEDVEEIRKEYDSNLNPNTSTTSNIHGNKEDDSDFKSQFGKFHFDKRLNQSAITKWQPFKDIYKFGRRIGNIQYKDDSWYAQIEPLLVKIRGEIHGKEARIRDKWARIRIRYNGEDLAVITAIRTLINV